MDKYLSTSHKRYGTLLVKTQLYIEFDDTM
jgi:hypothetical protein